MKKPLVRVISKHYSSLHQHITEVLKYISDDATTNATAQQEHWKLFSTLFKMAAVITWYPARPRQDSGRCHRSPPQWQSAAACTRPELMTEWLAALTSEARLCIGSRFPVR